MRKTGIGTIEMAEKLQERMSGVEIDKKGLVQVGNGISIDHDERRGMYIVQVSVCGKTASLEFNDASYVENFVLGAL